MTHIKTSTKTLALIISLFFVGCGEQSATSNDSKTEVVKSATTTKNSTDALSISQEEILTAINEARSVARDCNDGLGLVEAVQPLTWNSELYAAAYEHSSDMAESNTFSHVGSGTASDITGSNNQKSSKFNERIKANGYVNYRSVGENIAGGQESIKEVMAAWLGSPAHCTNIMNNTFKEVGVAIISNPNSDFGIYWTQNFGSKK